MEIVEQKLISVAVPVFNEQDNIEALYREVVQYLEPLPYRFELLFIDDGSKDATALVLDRIIQADCRVRALILARNFGFQTALTCGMENADGDAVITMDGDLQHPPALLPELIARWEAGAEVVQTIRKDTAGVSFFKKLTSLFFYQVINAISKVHIVEGGSDFRLLDRKVVLSFRRFKERAKFIRGIISSIGYRQEYIEFVAPPRRAGTSKLSFGKMLHFALDGITAYSRLPLRIAFYMGLLLGAGSFALLGHVLFIKVFTEEAVPGWATTSASILLLGGIQLIGLGIIGEYVGRIFEEVKQRPMYL
ncbi:MAG TPA: glycosyltransferase family 2 protein, partial [Negativicutes bacterium]|nr:glycosyltransferase family 2 protein [Negativicutes bacterium]